MGRWREGLRGIEEWENTVGLEYTHKKIKGNEKRRKVKRKKKRKKRKGSSMAIWSRKERYREVWEKEQESFPK